MEYGHRHTRKQKRRCSNWVHGVIGAVFPSEGCVVHTRIEVSVIHLPLYGASECLKLSFL